MHEPRTLLQLAGATPTPARIARAVLVVIDAQGEYADGALPLDGFGPALAAVRALLAAAREAGAPVVHVAHRGRDGGLFDRGGPGGAIVPEALPRPGEPVIEKTLPNAFAGTDLAARLRDLGRTDLVLAGFMTHNCVSATARAALDLGYRVTVAGDATATRALPDPLGGPPLPAEAVQRAALAALADRTAVVAPAREIVAPAPGILGADAR
ncbi:isochorismatase hydrolase [Methylobacterium sp. 4-46]|uniref:cysteine hydrolase family protein n=1 Tax=unclassified Methylobacterium TaxID=2615210 RepID=UPI000152D128|nr:MULTISPECIES: cysteine hydrolase family protein [Methylobacterium]ACA15045.1 isochorismatase hydrolase [Methylobacterium sp. 4-46]WFT80783.1 cysteine hydrolase family protein [Methylobacterium nodulans]